jgi:hypothetical protein
LIGFIQWHNEKPSCEACKIIHKNKGSVSPCETCREVLFEENEDAFTIYILGRNQLIVGVDIIDLNYIAIKTLMDLYEIKNQKNCFEKVVQVHNYFMEIRKNG